MNLPFTIKFFKKLEYFQTILRLDQQYKIQLRRFVNHKEKIFPTWLLEKKILRWAYLGNKKLRSPLNYQKVIDGTIKIDGINQNEISRIGIALDNLLIRGFADIYQKVGDPKSGTGVNINDHGLLMGELLEELFNLTKNNLNNNKLIFSSYYLFIISGWITVILSMLLLGLEICNLAGILDELKILTPKFYYLYYLIIFSPLWILLLALILRTSRLKTNQEIRSKESRN